MTRILRTVTRNGISVIIPRILGIIRKLAELTPIISKASICCVTRIVPISDAMFEPTFPARIRHIIDDENSSSMISLVTYPVTKRGIQGLCMLSFICMQITAPMKNDISRTIPMEFTPSADISFTYCFKNIRMRSGRPKARPMSMR